MRIIMFPALGSEIDVLEKAKLVLSEVIDELNMAS